MSGNKQMHPHQPFSHRPFSYYAESLRRKFNAKPPQPYACIRATLENEDTLYVNLLSWEVWSKTDDSLFDFSTIVVPKRRQLSHEVMAVFANPTILEILDFRTENAEEAEGPMNLLCTYLQEQHEGLKIREACVLREPVIWGELNDVWNSFRNALLSNMKDEYSNELKELNALSLETPSTSSSSSSSPSTSTATATSTSTFNSIQEDEEMMPPPPSP